MISKKNKILASSAVNHPVLYILWLSTSPIARAVLLDKEEISFKTLSITADKINELMTEVQNAISKID